MYAAKTGSDGGMNAAIGYAVYATASGGSSENYGVYSEAIDGADKNYAVYGTSSTAADMNYGGYFSASGAATANYGLYIAAGETKITDAGAAVPARTDNGSIATSTNGGNRIYFKTGSTNYYVNASGTGDYSEYFRCDDPSLTIGEIVSIDVADHNAVKKSDASYGDTQRMVGVISKYGTRNNDTNDGTRHNNKDYVNVGLLGQLQVKVSDENGAIAPGDALTLSKTKPGCAAKAVTGGRIIGYAMTHYPYVKGEITQPTHSAVKAEKDKLNEPHVMAFIQPGFWVPETKNENNQ